MTRRALLAGLLVAGVAMAAPLDGYRQRQAAGKVGGVAGRAYTERRRVNGSDQPLSGVGVVLLPRSAAFLARLAEIKARARDGMAIYRDSVPAIRRAREEYEQGLWQAGAADLVRGAVTGPDGRFRLENVPAGDWVLVAIQSTFVERNAGTPSQKERETYTRPPRMRGFQTVTVWLRELSIAGGQAETVELTDRNGWFSGVKEERGLDAGR